MYPPIGAGHFRRLSSGRTPARPPEPSGRLPCGHARRYPDIELDLAVSNRMIDVIAEGFDAGIT